MHIEKMKLSDLRPAEYNPRVKLNPGMAEYEKLKQSILEFGFVDPPILIKIQETWLVDINALLLQKNWGYLMR